MFLTSKVKISECAYWAAARFETCLQYIFAKISFFCPSKLKMCTRVTCFPEKFIVLVTVPLVGLSEAVETLLASGAAISAAVATAVVAAAVVSPAVVAAAVVVATAVVAFSVVATAFMAAAVVAAAVVAAAAVVTAAVGVAAVVAAAVAALSLAKASFAVRVVISF
jgi:hypothetical protein